MVAWPGWRCESICNICLNIESLVDLRCESAAGCNFLKPPNAAEGHHSRFKGAQSPAYPPPTGAGALQPGGEVGRAYWGVPYLRVV